MVGWCKIAQTSLVDTSVKLLAMQTTVFCQNTGHLHVREKGIPADAPTPGRDRQVVRDNVVKTVRVDRNLLSPVINSALALRVKAGYTRRTRMSGLTLPTQHPHGSGYSRKQTRNAFSLNRASP